MCLFGVGTNLKAVLFQWFRRDSEMKRRNTYLKKDVWERVRFGMVVDRLKRNVVGKK